MVTFISGFLLGFVVASFFTAYEMKRNHQKIISRINHSRNLD